MPARIQVKSLPDRIAVHQHQSNQNIKIFPRACAAGAARALLVMLLLGAAACRNAVPASARQPGPARFVLAFGSCALQTEPQPIWGPIAASRPDIFLFLGDTVYADTASMEVKRQAYATLAGIPGFRDLRKSTPILAMWDDHDYGYNDVGGEYPEKIASQRLFLDFFQEPADSPRRKRPGIYGSYYYGQAPRLIQVILLDTRYFRDSLELTVPRPSFKTAYKPTTDKNKTILGSDQWEWLEKELGKPAQVRIIATGIQLVTDGHQGEKWGNFPHELARLYRLIERTGAEGAVVISGDRHYAEFSAEREGVPYPLYDFTSSSLNRGWAKGAREPNRHRIGTAVPVPNFGLITIDWKAGSIIAEIRGDDGRLLLSHTVDMGELKIKK